MSSGKLGQLPFRVQVRSADLWAALGYLAAAPKRSRTVRVSFRDGELELVRGLSEARIPAVGDWSGEATVNAQFVNLRLLRNDYPDAVIIEGTPLRINVGSSYSISCTWEPVNTWAS